MFLQVKRGIDIDNIMNDITIFFHTGGRIQPTEWSTVALKVEKIYRKWFSFRKKII